MSTRKPSHLLRQQAAAGLLLLIFCLGGMTTVQAKGAAVIGLLAQFDDGSYPAGLVYGPNESLWVSLSGTGSIGQTSGLGTTTWPLPDRSMHLRDLTIGSDQALWFSVLHRNQIIRMDPAGGLSEFSLGEGSSGAAAVTLGQDLALWFTESEANRIGRLTSGGDLTGFDLPEANSLPMSIISAQNGDLWFTEWGSFRIGKITLQGKISEYDLPNRNARPADLLVGPDGNIWVAFNTGKNIARFNPNSETFDLFALKTINASLADITLGPDNRIWFIGTNTVGRFDLVGSIPENLIEEALPSPVYTYQGRSQMITGPDNDLIFSTANSSTIYRSALDGGPILRDLQVFITYQPPLLLSAGEFYIDSKIVNWTNTAATNVEINLTLDENIHFVSADLPGGSCVDHGLNVQCILPSLSAGANLPVRFVMSTERNPPGLAQRTLSLEVSSAEGDYQPANNRVVLPTTIQNSLEYLNDFSTGADEHWSQTVTSTPMDGLTMLGLFDNDEVAFNWDDLPVHDSARLCFDLYVLGPWSGSQFLDQDDTTIIGPDFWTSYVNNHASDSWQRLTFTTFSNLERYQQAFPADYQGAVFPSQTNAHQVGEFDGSPGVRDSRYRFCYQLEHANLSLNLLLKGLNLDGLAHEKWAIDNVGFKIFYDASVDRTYMPVLVR